MASESRIGLHPFAWWAVLGLASICLSYFFNAFKLFTLNPDLNTGANFLLMTMLAVGSIVILVYDGYAKDKAKGRVIRTFWLFEWAFAKQYPDFSLMCNQSVSVAEEK